MWMCMRHGSCTATPHSSSDRALRRRAMSHPRVQSCTVCGNLSIHHWRLGTLLAGWSAVFRRKMKSRARVVVLFRTSVSAPDALRRPFFRRIGRRRPPPCRASVLQLAAGDGFPGAVYLAHTSTIEALHCVYDSARINTFGGPWLDPQQHLG